MNPKSAAAYLGRKFEHRVRHPFQTMMEITEIYHRFLRRRTGIDVMAEDWDNLIILDACRYDLFESVNTIEGDLRPVISKAGWTPDFLARNFNSDTFPETVYISANPMLVRTDAQFHARIRLWEDYWSEETNVVPPWAVAESTLKTAVQFPNKRLIIHFMQPHHPFIGDIGRRLDEESKVNHFENGITFWNQLRKMNEQTRDLFWQAYKENLELTLPEVRRLVETLHGKTIVTSDHGNEFGKYGIYGHMRGYTEALRRVPWLVTNFESRKQIIAGNANAGPTNETVREGNLAKERLRDLGYITD